ncbi:MAG: tetratricopeptide repeat protein [bacterium]|nr:tetratricopeptide repeat protein [bacterium]
MADPCPRRTPTNPASVLLLSLVMLLTLVATAAASVVRMDIVSREALTEGAFNPKVGAYEKITGVLHLEVDPDDPVNARIVDLHLAPRNARGRVEFSTEFELHQPLEPARGNGRLLYVVSNRGSRQGPGFFSAGLDFNWLWDQGYSYLMCGWGCDVMTSDRRLNITVPVATVDGAPITGRVHAEIINYQNFPVPSLPLTWGGSIPHAAVSLDGADAQLTRRRYSWDEPEIVPPGAWSFARFEDGATVPDPRHLYVKSGIEPGWLYDLVYTASNPPVTGLGLAAIRDVVSFFRYGDGEAPVNPLAGHVERAYSWGHSQSGRLLHHFVWEGFNSDAAGRLVFDGVMPNCPGAGKGQFNSRFAQTTRHGSHLEDNLYPVDVFPFTFGPQTDPLTGATGDALALARKLGNVPKMMVLNSSTDYWTRAASLLHTDVTGTADAPIDPSVRIYALAGIAHTQNRAGVVGRALLTALDAWVSHGVLPPNSQIPRIADGTLVGLDAVRERFPRVPGLHLPESFYHPYRLDPGPRWANQGIADHVPPVTGPRYVCLVPQVDADGNEVAGIRLPEVEAPLATICGWNLRNPSFSHSLGRNSGRSWPLTTEVDARRESGDTRPAIGERYASPADYRDRAVACADRLLAERLILPRDHEVMLEAAAKQSSLIHELRALDKLVAGDPAAAREHLQAVSEAGLDWFYGQGRSIGFALNMRGYGLMADGDLAGAEKSFLLNTELYPDDANVWDSLAECYFNQKRWQEAQDGYEKSLSYNPGNDNARHMLSRIEEDRAESGQ